MGVQQIGEGHAQKVVEVLEGLVARAKSGKMVSLAFIAEETGTTEVIAGLVGRYREEPKRAVADLAVVQNRLTFIAAETKPPTFIDSKS